MSTIAVVINPNSGGGWGQKLWKTIKPGLEALFEHVNYRISNKVDDLAVITQSLLEQQPEYLLIIGGDGTLNYALNGALFEDNLRIPVTKLAYFNTGSGGDFARQFPVQHVTEFLNRLVHDQVIQTNIGKITFADNRIRYFLNVTSCGLSAQVIRASAENHWMKKLGGTINYLIHSLKSLVRYKRTEIKITIDDKESFHASMLMMAICNGRFFGGGMNVAPLAKIDDNVLDVVLLKDLTVLQTLIKFPKIYFGTHLLEPNVHYIQAQKIEVEPLDSQTTFLESDGELVGQLPAIIELLPQKLALIV